MKLRRGFLFVVLIFLCFGAVSEVHADDENSSVNSIEKPQLPTIVLAVSNATSGPASKLGIRLNQGASAYFHRLNKNGGINGQSIYMSHLDDGYEPYKTLKNTKNFLEKGELFGFFNYVGTPTSFAVFEVVTQSNLPFLTPFTGAEFLRTPVSSNIFNLRASYRQEVKAQLKYLLQHEAKRIGLLVQADEFGKTVESGYLKEMAALGISPA